MSLSADLISQFVKTTNDSESKERNNIVYGTVVSVGDEKFVLLDGNDEASGQLTPISTVTDLVVGDRVCVEINNHTAMVSGNMTAPIKRSNLGEGGNLKIDNLIAGKIDTDLLVAASGEFRNIRSKYAEIQNLDVENLTAKYADIDTLKAKTAFITNLEGGSINFDCANFDEATFESFFAKSGIIKDLDINGATVSGELVGVTIRGDLIQAGTLVADKLVIKTQDGLLWKLNAAALGEAGMTDREDVEDLQNGLHGSIINDKTIVANKINVSDLVAFDATIAGFNIKKDTENDALPGRLYSGSKGSIDSDATPGIYIDDTGQMNIGDLSSYIKFYKKDDGTFKLEIAADEMELGSSKQKVLETLNSISDKALSGVDVEYYSSTSSTSLVDGSWQSDAPTWTDGRYIWSRTKIIDAKGNVTYTNHVCITGNTGAAGKDGSNGKDGTDGINGTNGTDGRSIGRIENYYMVSNQDSGITNMDRLFGTEIPTMTSTDKYLWNYEEIYDTSDALITRTDARIIGVYGDKGDQGIQGPSGSDGTTYYTWLKYADTPTSGMSDSPTGKSYIGLAYNKTSAIESSNYSDYMWSLIKGEKGDTGVQGPSGSDGTTYYTWIKYATSSTGSDMNDDPTGKSYIGLAYNKTSQTESSNPSDYTWSLIKGSDGSDGVGITSIQELYYLSTSDTECINGAWSEDEPIWSEGRYIWTKSRLFFDNGEYQDTTPILSVSMTGVNETVDQAAKSYSEFQKLNDSMKSLIVDKNGSTLLKQTTNGWSFNFGPYLDTIEDLGDKLAYINIDKTVAGNPQILLGKADSDFKLKLTNKDINFQVGASTPTKIDHNGLNTEDITVKDEFIHGGFMWKKRSNGHLGLSWKG